MAMHRYLSGTGKEQRLRRVVPAALREIAGCTQWVERVQNLPPAELKKRANKFAVRTDAQIEMLRLKAATLNENKTAQMAELLHKADVRSLAHIYQTEWMDDTALDGSLLLVGSETDKTATLAEAVADLQNAEQRLTTRPLGEPLVVDFLKKKEVIPEHLSAEQTMELCDSEMFCKLADLVAQIDFENAKLRVEFLTGSQSNFTHQLLSGSYDGKSKVGAPTSSRKLGDAVECFLDQRQYRSVSRKSQFNLPIRVLEEEFGLETPLTEISREEVRKLAKFLPSIPANPANFYPGGSLQDAAARWTTKTGKTGERYAEAEKHLAVIKTIFGTALNEGWISSNPATGIIIDKPKVSYHEESTNTYRPFSVDELNRIFQLPYFHGCVNDENNRFKIGPNLPMRHEYWAPLISLWSGLRMNEILQLETLDIVKSDKGIYFFDITDQVKSKQEGGIFSKQLKTKQAVRRVPIHPQLHDFGFVAWARKQHGRRLFPEAIAGSDGKYSTLYSKRFRTSLVNANAYEHRRAVFHSFRNNFNDALREAQVNLELRETINGWRSGGSVDQKYGSGFSIERLFEAVAKVRYPEVAVGHLVSNRSKI